MSWLFMWHLPDAKSSYFYKLTISGHFSELGHINVTQSKYTIIFKTLLNMQSPSLYNGFPVQMFYLVQTPILTLTL